MIDSGNTALPAEQARALSGLIEEKMQKFAAQLVARFKEMPPCQGAKAPRGSDPHYWEVDMELLAADMAVALGAELTAEATALLLPPPV